MYSIRTTFWPAVDILQLEQTGRLFAAVNGGSKSGPAAQATKLKRELPRSISRFHESLDQLEDELVCENMLSRLRDRKLMRCYSNSQRR